MYNYFSSTKFCNLFLVSSILYTFSIIVLLYIVNLLFKHEVNFPTRLLTKKFFKIFISFFLCVITNFPQSLIRSMSRNRHEAHFLSTYVWVTGSQAIFSRKSWHFVGMSMLSQFFLIHVKRSSRFSQTGHQQFTCGILLLPMYFLWELIYLSTVVNEIDDRLSCSFSFRRPTISWKVQSKNLSVLYQHSPSSPFPT